MSAFGFIWSGCGSAAAAPQQAARQHPAGAAGRAGVDLARTRGHEGEGPGAAGRVGRKRWSAGCTVVEMSARDG